MKRDLTVYVASAWWRNSDPHTAVVALTEETAQKAIEDSIRERARDAWDSGEPEYCDGCHEEMTLEEAQSEHGPECLEDAQAWSGVFPESLRSILEEHKGSEYRLRAYREIKADLRASGVAYTETF